MKMNIIKENCREFTFGDTNVGDIFIGSTDDDRGIKEVLIRTENCGGYNCVALGDGLCYTFENNEPIRFVNAVLHYEED